MCPVSNLASHVADATGDSDLRAIILLTGGSSEIIRARPLLQRVPVIRRTHTQSTTVRVHTRAHTHIMYTHTYYPRAGLSTAGLIIIKVRPRSYLKSACRLVGKKIAFATRNLYGTSTTPDYVYRCGCACRFNNRYYTTVVVARVPNVSARYDECALTFVPFDHLNC